MRAWVKVHGNKQKKNRNCNAFVQIELKFETWFLLLFLKLRRLFSFVVQLLIVYENFCVNFNAVSSTKTIENKTERMPKWAQVNSTNIRLLACKRFVRLFRLYILSICMLCQTTQSTYTIFLESKLKYCMNFGKFWAANCLLDYFPCNYRSNSEFRISLITSTTSKGNGRKNEQKKIFHYYWIMTTRIEYIFLPFCVECCMWNEREREISVASKRNGSLIKTKTWTLDPKIGRTIDDAAMKSCIIVKKSNRSAKQKDLDSKRTAQTVPMYQNFVCIHYILMLLHSFS